MPTVDVGVRRTRSVTTRSFSIDNAWEMALSFVRGLSSRSPRPKVFISSPGAARRASSGSGSCMARFSTGIPCTTNWYRWLVAVPMASASASAVRRRGWRRAKYDSSGCGPSYFDVS
jgi:hypothetical protein